MFHGPPGTGKSSTAFALATHLKKESYTLNLNGVRDEAHSRNLFRQPSSGDMILVEDIDCANIEREDRVISNEDEDDDEDFGNKKKKKKGVSLSGC